MLIYILYKILFKSRAEKYLTKRQPKLRNLKEEDSNDTSSSDGDSSGDDFDIAQMLDADQNQSVEGLKDAKFLEDLLLAYKKRKKKQR